MARGRRDRTHRGTFANAEFRTPWLAYAQSMVGDQLARVALSIMVFNRTGSPAWTAATYALTFLPALVAGVLLSGLADRFPRREVMVSADLIRAVMVALMALPSLPLPAVAVLLILVELAEAPFGAAQGAVLPTVLGDQLYEHGQRIMMITRQVCQIAGFAVGGLLVAWLGPNTSLAVNACTFLISAVAIRVYTIHRPAVHVRTPGTRWGLRSQVRTSAHMIWTDKRLRALVCLAWLTGFFIAPEGLAAPLADELHTGDFAVGLLLAASPAGTVIGAYLLGRTWITEQRRLHWLGPLAIGANVPLVIYLMRPNLAVAVSALVASGACSAYVITAGAVFVRLTPDAHRGQALGLARSGLTAAQGIGIAVGGLIAQGTGSARITIGVIGAAGVLCATAAALAWSAAKPLDIAAILAETSTPTSKD